MLLALEEAPFVLLGPKPPIPASGWESYGLMALVVLPLAAVAVFALRRILRAERAELTPLAQLELSLRAAEHADDGEAVPLITRAFRTYLAAIEPRATASLSTEELVALLSGLPLFLPARQPLHAALRSADAAKFAGAPLQAPLLIAGVREAARRIEDARRTFAKPVVAPLLPPTPRPAGPVEPPPVPGPPPLPRRNPA